MAAAPIILSRRFNNVYHNTFFKLFQVALRCNHEPSLKAILKNGFLTKCIEHYLSNEPSGMHLIELGFLRPPHHVDIGHA